MDGGPSPKEKRPQLGGQAEAVSELPSAGGLRPTQLRKAIIPDSFPGTNLGSPAPRPKSLASAAHFFERTEFHSAPREADRFVCPSVTLSRS